MKRMCFIKSEVEGEIYAMKEKISTNKILASTSLVFGILSLFSFALYFYSANHAPYTYIDVIFRGPLCSFIGIVISIITRKTRKIHPVLWISGIISCMLGFIVYLDRIEYEVRPETKWLVYYHSDEDLKRLKSVFGITGISRKFEVYFRKSDNFRDR